MSRLNEEHNTLRLQVNHLNAQPHILSGQVHNLQVKNARLRALLSTSAPPPSVTNRMYTERSGNILHLSDVIMSLATMRDRFQRQGTLK